MSVLKVGDVGKIIRIGANYDLSKATVLKLIFAGPSGKEKPLTNEFHSISVPDVPHTGVDQHGDEVTFKAGEYWEYHTDKGLLDEVGTWRVTGVYIEGTAKNFPGDTVLFKVE